MDASESIPLFLWERILKEPTIVARDVLSICSTCKRFREFLLHNGFVWRAKVSQRWPRLSNELGKDTVDEWFQIYQQRCATISAVTKLLEDLSSRFLRQSVIHLSNSVYAPMLNFAAGFDRGSLFLIDELRYILNDTSHHIRLTDKYYAAGALRYFVQQKLETRWRDWLEGSQLLEIGGWLFAQWFCPAEYLDDALLTREMEKIAEVAKRKLMETNKRHPLLTGCPVDHANLRETVWSVSDTREVIDALSFVFNVLHGYRGNAADYYNADNSFMHKVLSSKLGIPITLSILYHAAARRLGVYCAPVNFPGHFVLKFLDNPNLSEAEKYTYIDVFNSCRLMREDQVLATHGPTLRRDSTYFEVPSSVAVITRMLHNVAHIHERYQPTEAVVVCSAWELGVILRPMEFDVRFALARTYSHLDINIEKILELMEGIPEPTEELRRAQRQHFIEMARTRLLTEAVYEPVPTSPQRMQRSTHMHVRHGVGMIMRHRQYHYMCVITGWDPICAAANSWKQQMGVQNLSRKDEQPFYHVLVNDGTNRYAAEENMVFEPNPMPIKHPEVGRFFQEYCGRYYKMNKERKLDYPDDEDAAVAYVNTAYETDHDSV